MPEVRTARAEKRARGGAHFDVFLSYNSRDGAIVERIAERLKRSGLEPWLDRWAQTPGGEWQEELGRGVEASRACAIFVGPSDLGAWGLQELAFALDRSARERDFRVFPVLLPGVREPFDPTVLPHFLRTRTWVDFRRGYDSQRALQDLIAAVRGVPFGPSVPIEPWTGIRPYRGLQPFGEEDAKLFFGRDREVQRLSEMLKGARFLAVVGASGSGKSSLVRAGLVPALRAGALSDVTGWTVCLLEPGADPLGTLAARIVSLANGAGMQATLDALGGDPRTLHLATALALADRPNGQRLLLIVDQLEETFTLANDEEARHSFFDNLIFASSAAGGRCTVAVTVRADFYPRLAAYPELAQQVAAHQFLLTPMDRDGLRQVIEEPARLAGMEFESGLVETIIEDVASQPGALPLLEHALLELSDRQRGHMLTLEGYRESGGVSGALATRAEAIYDRFDAERKAVTQRVLLRLTQPGEGTEDTRRRATMKELVSGRGEAGAVERVVEDLASARMLTVSGGGTKEERWVDVSHEALIRGWQRLRGWVDEDREGLRVHRRITAAASEWVRLDRDHDALDRGARLLEAEEWRTRHPAVLNDLEREFLEASATRQRRERAAHRRRVRLAFAGLGVALAVVSVAAGVALFQREHMSEQRDVALSRQLAVNANASLTSNSALSLQLALRAYGVSPTPEAEAALRQATWGFRAVAAARRHDRALSVAVAPDGQRLASTGYDGTVILWSWPDYRPVVVAKGPRSKLWGLAFSPDGGQLATAGSDGAIRVGSSDDPVATARVIGKAYGPVQAIAFSPNGESVASASEDGSVVRWPVEGGAPTVYDAKGGPKMYAVAFSPDGRLLATGGRDGRIHVWATDSRSPRRELSAASSPVYQLSFSPDGTRLAAAADDGTTRIWSMHDEEGPVNLRGDPEAAFTVAFSPDSDRVAVAGESGTIRVWTARGELLQEMTGQEGRTHSVAWLRDGRHVASAGLDGTTWVWEPAMPAVLRADDNPVLAVAFSPDGDVATGSVGGAVRWWDATTGRSSTIARVPPAALGVDVSPYDGRVAVAADDGTILLADENGRTEMLARGDHPVFRATFSDDGRRLVTAEFGGAVRVYSLRHGVSSRVIARHRTLVHDAVFSSDPAAVASTGQDGLVRITDLATGRSRAFRGQGTNVYSIAFSPNGRELVGASSDGSVALWTRSGRQLLVFQGHTGAAIDAALTTEGTLVSAGADGTVRAWSPSAREAVGLGATSVLLRAGDGGINDLDVSADGRIATADNDGAAMVWRCEVCGPVASVLRLARRRATPPLSPAEQLILQQGAE